MAASDLIPLSHTQEQLWFAERLETDRTLYTESLSLRLHGDLSTSALERALWALINRHEILRTVVVAESTPMMRVHEPPVCALSERLSLRELDPTRREERLSEVATRFVESPVDLATGPLFRSMLVELSDDDHALILAMHHLIADGLSAGIILEELSEDYEAFVADTPSVVQPPGLQYADFALWEHELFAAHALERDSTYWRDTLDEVPATLELPLDRLRPPTKGTEGRRLEFALGDHLGSPLLGLARRNSVTTYVALLAAFAGLVHRYTGRDDFVLGTLVANRHRPELEGVVGQFANTVPLRLDISGDPSLNELLRRCARICEQAINHGQFGLGKIIEVARPERDRSRNALIQHLFLSKQNPVRVEHLGSTQVTPFEVDRTRGRLDTIIEVEAEPGRLRAWVEYDTALFDDTSVAQFMNHYGQMLEEWIVDPTAPLSQLKSFDDEWEPLAKQDTAARTYSTASELLDAVRPAYDTAPMLIAGERTWTWSGLRNEITERTRNGEVGELPDQQRAAADDVADAVIEGLARLLSTSAFPVSTVVSRDQDTSCGDTTRTPSFDSTAIAPRAFGLAELLGLDASDRVLVRLCPPDALITTLAAMSVGAIVIFASDSPDRIAEEAANHEATVAAVYAGEITKLPVRELPHLRTIAVDGLLPSWQVRLWAQEEERSLVRLIHPVQSSDALLVAPLFPDTNHLVAEPAGTDTYYVLDEQYRTVPRGVPGYLHVEEHTSVPDGGSAGLQPTSILARRTRSGAVDLLEDAQIIDNVKTEITPHTVAEVACSHPSVLKAIAVFEGNTSIIDTMLRPAAFRPDTHEFHEYLVSRLPIDSVLPEVRIVSELPNNEVSHPAESGSAPTIEPTLQTQDDLLGVILELWNEALGLGEVGPDDDFFALGGHSMLAARLLGTVRETLEIELSLRALFENPTPGDLANEIRRRYPEMDEVMRLVASMPVKDVEEIADTDSPTADSRMSGTKNGVRFAPLSLAQLQIWLMEQLRPGQLTHTIPLLLTIEGPLNVQLLRSAINNIVARQEGLRTTFVQVDGEPRQRVEPYLELGVPLIDLSSMPAEERHREAERLGEETAHRGFDLAKGPLLDAQVVRLEEREHVLHLHFHHLITDEVSMTIFMRELSEFYQARVEDRQPQLPKLSFQYADLVTDERDLIAGPVGDRLRHFWRRELVGAPELQIATDHPRPSELTFEGEFLIGTAPLELFDAVKELARQQRATAFAVYLAAISTLLHRLTGQDDLIVGVPSDNRDRVGSELLIGCFLNVLPLRVKCSESTTFLQLLTQVKEQMLKAYEHQQLPLAEIVEAVQPERSSDRLPLFQVTCELQLAGWMPLELPECKVDYSWISHGTARYDMAFHAIAKSDCMVLALELNTNLWDMSTGWNTIDQVHRVLRQVTADPTRPLAAYSVEA